MIRNLATRALSRTIWANGAIPDAEAKYATPLKRVALPIYDAIMVLAGIFAVRSGVPAFDQTLPNVASIILGYLFAALALACLAGIIFPALYGVEFAGKALLFGALGIYFICLIALGESGGTTRYFVSMIVLAAMTVPPIRMWILGIEIRDRKAKV